MFSPGELDRIHVIEDEAIPEHTGYMLDGLDACNGVFYCDNRNDRNRANSGVGMIVQLESIVKFTTLPCPNPTRVILDTWAII